MDFLMNAKDLFLFSIILLSERRKKKSKRRLFFKTNQQTWRAYIKDKSS